MATAQAHYLETQLWLANALEQTAAWRESKAAEYPDDPRNRRAATALRQAAYHLRSVQLSPGVDQIAELVHDCLASGIDLLADDSGLPGPESERVAGRYYFDRYGDMPDASAHEELALDLYRAMLRDVGEYDYTPGSPLGQRLDTEEPATSAIVDPIAEVRELLRESQAQNRQARRLDQLHRISALVANLRAIAESEAETNGNIQQAAHVPHARKRLELALTTYRVLGGDHELEACETLATGSEITHSQNIVSHAANAFDELVRAAREEEV